jgi:hypothetical protein
MYYKFIGNINLPFILRIMLTGALEQWLKKAKIKKIKLKITFSRLLRS